MTFHFPRHILTDGHPDLIPDPTGGKPIHAPTATIPTEIIMPPPGFDPHHLTPADLAGGIRIGWSVPDTEEDSMTEHRDGWEGQGVDAEHMVAHGFTPGKFSPEVCQVQLARYPCPYSRVQHDPELPPEDIDAFGRRRTKRGTP